MTSDRTGTSPTSRPHLAARLEDAVNRLVHVPLRRRGWVARIEPYTGYGMPGWVRVMGRALLAPPGTDVGEATERDPAARDRAVRGWRSFLTAQVPGARVEVRVGDRTHEVVADRGGYVDAVVESDLPPGRHDVVLSLDGQSVTAGVVVLAPGRTTAMVSDVDDTVMVTALPRPLLAAWNSMVLHQNARRPVTGMADLYRRWQAANPGAPTFYLSTGAWNVAPALTRFLDRHGFPTGPFLLTDWGPTNTGWFRSGQDHKLQSLRRLMSELPDVRWVLVGDDGQHDPQIYAEIAREFPDRVELIALRQLTAAEQILSHGTPGPADDDQPERGEAGTASTTRSEKSEQSERTDGSEAPERSGPPVVRGVDGNALALRLIDAGLLPTGVRPGRAPRRAP